MVLKIYRGLLDDKNNIIKQDVKHETLKVLLDAPFLLVLRKIKRKFGLDLDNDLLYFDDQITKLKNSEFTGAADGAKSWKHNMRYAGFRSNDNKYVDDELIILVGGHPKNKSIHIANSIISGSTGKNLKKKGKKKKTKKKKTKKKKTKKKKTKKKSKKSKKKTK
jgi:hypothetical protein